MNNAWDRHYKQKLESDDGLKIKIERVTSGTILKKEKKKQMGKIEGKKEAGVYEVLVQVQNVQCAC